MAKNHKKSWRPDRRAQQPANNTGQRPPAANPNDLPNLGRIFQFEYFADFDAKDVLTIDTQKNAITVTSRQHINKKLYNADLQRYHRQIESLMSGIPAAHGFELQTTYPGLLAGSGYAHETGATDELKLGFSFDHTTGLPVIPGASVKGILRSVFETEKAGFLRSLVLRATESPLSQLPWDELDEALVDKLRFELFGPDTGEAAEASTMPRTSRRDTFFDAFPVRSNHPFHGPPGKPAGKLFDSDFITPHINRKNRKLDPFTNPVPIQFLKVMPSVVFKFRFQLHPSAVWPALTAELKQELFKHILLHLGAGAKTNVGYGQFEPV